MTARLWGSDWFLKKSRLISSWPLTSLASSGTSKALPMLPMLSCVSRCAVFGE